MTSFGSDSGRSASAGLGTSQGLGLGLGASRGLGLGLGLGLGNGLGTGRGLGLGLGLGNGVGLGSGLGLGLGLGSGLGLGDTPYPAGAIPEGADGGIGLVRSYYATPIELALLPWSLDFTPDNSGVSPFPLEFIINPYQPDKAPLEWTTQDWDPALRFWTLPFDPHMTEWLRAADRSEPATLAALEFAGHWQKWLPETPGIAGGIDPVNIGWFETADLGWQPGSGNPFNFIKGELEQLRIYMEDDRQKYLVECDVQADGLPAYLIHFLGINALDHPNTLKLIDIGLALGNVAYMAYKAHYKRVRPSILRPGLTVPFGPPAHPAFPSGHSFLAHFISLLLLEIPGIYFRFGVLPSEQSLTDGTMLTPLPEDGGLLIKPKWDDLAGAAPIASPLLSVAHRIAVNRERIGVHYPSDSTGSRHLAAGIWDALINRPLQNTANQNSRAIDCPTLITVLEHAKIEWPTPWTPNT